MNAHRLLLTALLACFALPALAEEVAPLPALPPQGEFGHPDEALRMVHRGHTQVVKNAPYSAQAVSERLQHLPDGNQIERRTRSASYRDSAGRTRHEVRNDKGELRTVTINDPVAGAMWILNPQERSAQRLPSRVEIERIAREAREKARAQVERMRREGRLPALARREGEDGVAVRVERRTGDERDGHRETVRVIRMAPGPAFDGAAFGARMGPMIASAVTGALADRKWAAKAVSRDLGTRDFEGVKAEGKQRSYEIPAGEVGNRNPIVVSDETWYAPDLQVTVYSKHSDPRSGDYVYRLEGIKRGEPDASLFAVPSDYQVREPGKRLGGKSEE
ncbi:hypothetical protein [Massilia sp. Mn16-1_5]|uniref:hypothetical protein n=1 Tax=Massilia sp. Mn16-1_5 TaxID=2079199 RepID=UPI00109EA060|nr:hypothetical protein [Massilia sp. Mn16-1_5]THC44280.1 hypothetical protein C2862_10395 [Massilia sp. Mn16-1_5]